ncbi:uncharacterized protein [Henckelia pumila]|uniref:uncharacterized protein n=1 Tax=Henckelia pumila TaxID=405737 RepID=UPI003C6DC958
MRMKGSMLWRKYMRLSKFLVLVVVVLGMILAKKGSSVDNFNQNQVATQSNWKNVSHENIPKKTKCKLLRWCGDEVVAEGRIASTNPTVKVHHVPLGGSCWKVWIDRVLMEQVDLIRPNSEMIFLDDAVGNTIAWFS